MKQLVFLNAKVYFFKPMKFTIKKYGYSYGKSGWMWVKGEFWGYIFS